MIRPVTTSAEVPAKATILSFLKQVILKTWRPLLGLSGLCLAWHVLAEVAWNEVWALFTGITPLACLIITSVNLLMLPLMAGRWWYLLKTLGTPINLLTASAYRMASGAVSYLTPGPLFGGEPLAIYLLHRRHGISLAAATTSVAADRLFELTASFVILILCLNLRGVNETDLLPQDTAMFLTVTVLAIVACIPIAVVAGKRPLGRLRAFFVRDDRPTASFFYPQRCSFLLIGLLSLIQWVAVFTEFWLMAYFLDYPLSFSELAAVVVVARLAFFTPMPAGLGVLETALPWVTKSLGLGSKLGVGLCLIIRFRDLIVNLTGLGLTIKYITFQKKDYFF